MLVLVHLLHAWEWPEFSAVSGLSFPGLAEREDVWEAGNEGGEWKDIEVTLSGKYNSLVYSVSGEIFSFLPGQIGEVILLH